MGDGIEHGLIVSKWEDGGHLPNDAGDFVDFLIHSNTLDKKDRVGCCHLVQIAHDHGLPTLTEPKSNFLETILSAFPPLPLPDNFLFLLFGPAALTPGPEETGSAFPSKSSNGLEE